MSYRIRCRTLFDITTTGIRGHYKPSNMTFNDTNGNLIDTMESWTRARNQQRNWETFNQIISLRTLPQNITSPCIIDTIWEFEFDVENIATTAWGVDPVGALRFDSEGVPMITGLLESDCKASSIISYGNDSNTWFVLV